MNMGVVRNGFDLNELRDGEVDEEREVQGVKERERFI